MNTRPSGVDQTAATVAEGQMIATTVSSMPAWCMVWRKRCTVSIRPVAGSTSEGSWYSQPGWCSSEPWWWSTVITTVPISRTAAAR